MTEAELLAALPGLAFALGLVLCRVGGLVMLMPGFGEAETPMMLRAGLALGLSVLLLPTVAPLIPAAPEGMSGPQMIAAELVTGAALGWLARLPVLALSMAGGFMATLLGLSSVLQPDPSMGGQSTALARLLGLAAPVLIFASGLYALPLQALVGSYSLVKPGGVLPPGDTADLFAHMVATTFALALQLAAPFLVASVVFQVAVGLLARIAPQLQAFSVAAPAQILGGIVLLALLAARILNTWQGSVAANWAALPGS